MKIPLFQVDAFSKKPFAGNPAAICLLDSWLGNEVLQKIAAENNVSETAFLVPLSPGNYDLRWFTPTMEVDLCGHATLASAFALFEYYDNDKSVLRFQTASGELSVAKSGDLLAMNMHSETHSPWLAAGLVSESDISNLPYGDDSHSARKSDPVARSLSLICCGELQFSGETTH